MIPAGNVQAGLSVASAGDVNGDNLVDYLIGVRVADTNISVQSAATYLIFGNTGLASSQLSTASQGVVSIRIDGQMTDARSGWSVASAGDVNGDGLADVIVGAPSAGTNGRLDSGSSYVVFGQASWPTNIDLANLGSGGFRIDGDVARAASGMSVASAGDVNGDGFADIVIGAPGVGPDGEDPANPTVVSGSSYVVFGKASNFGTVDLASLGTAGFRINGAAGADYSGISVASAGDMNGDGFADLIIGSSQADNNGRTNSGSAHVVFGKASGFGTVNLADLGSAGFRIDGAASGDLAGMSVASAGDMNGDGFGDVILGAPNAGNNARPASGSSYVIFGKATGLATIDLATLSAAAGFRIDGAASSDATGGSVAAAGDVNGDGFSEIIIGGPGADNGTTDSGSSYLLLGKASGFATIDLAALGDAGVRVDGVAANDGSGRSVAGAGDVNGDGFADILIGADGVGRPSTSDPNGLNQSAVAAYTVLSQQTGNATLLGTTLADRLFGGAGNDTLRALAGDDLLLGRAGNDALNGGAGNDTLDGGDGNDTAIYNADPGTLRIRQSGSGLTVEAGALGTDSLTSIEFFSTNDGSVEIFADLTGLFRQSIGSENILLLGTKYSGPVATLERQLFGTGESEVYGGTRGNDFMNLFAGDDAANGGAGNDVIDGGLGSNFLTGGAGKDVFFSDGRGGGVTWTTITDWEVGEQLSVWGWRPGVSRIEWVDSDGVGAFKGVTMRGDLNGDGQNDTIVTWTDKTRADLPTPVEFNDLLWFIG